MPAGVSRREIDREADDHIELGRLLRKERDERKKRAVDRILAAELRVQQKIERIREIDEQENEQEVDGIVRKAHQQAGRRWTDRIRDRIKAPKRAIPYLSFLFHEMKRIRDFGSKTHVLSTRIFPPGIRLNRELQIFFVRDLQTWAAELSPRLKLVSEHGWLHLTPLQYNLCVLLKQLSDRILSFDFIHLNYRDRNLIDKFKRLESIFLMLHYKPEYMEMVLNSLLIVSKKQGREEQEGDETRTLALRILAEDVTLPSLYYSLVGINILKFRRFLTLADLMHPGFTEVVDTEEFNCPSDVRKRIDEYITDSIESIKKLHGQLHEVRRLNSFLSYDEKGSPDTKVVRSLYESVGSARSEESLDYNDDQDNVLLFARRLFQAFYNRYFPLLNGRVQIEGVGKAAVFSRSFYELELGRLATVIDKLEKGPFHFGKFPLQRYLQVKEAKIGAIGNEKEVIQLIDEGIACLVDLGKSLAKVLGSSISGIEPEKAEPLEPVVFQGKPYSIPHGGRRLLGPAALKGLTVTEAIENTVAVCFTAGLQFKDRFIFFFLGRERRFETELQSRMKFLKNLVDPASYQEISARYQ